MQGQTEPLLASTGDGALWVVKSSRSSVDALVCKYLAACLAREIGLPIPQFGLVEAQASRFVDNEFEEVRYLSREPGFASKFLSNQMQLAATEVFRVPSNLRARVLLFDLWIANRDRSDDNSNLLLDPLQGDLTVIDHNLSFGEVDGDLLAMHIFRDSVRDWTTEFRKTQQPILLGAASRMEVFWNELPDAWTERTTIDRTYVTSLLSRAGSDHFWQRP